jgi:hypothetical protein
MPQGNPLVAQEVSTTTAVTGIGIAESCTDLASGISDGSWVAVGLGAVGVGLEVLSMVVDPIGTLASYGVSWLIEHVEPLKEALDWLAGDPPVIQSFSETWANVAAEVGAIAGDLGNEGKTGTAGWTGEAGDAYRQASAEQADALAGAATLSEGISVGVMIMGEVVAAVREIVRDLVAELVGKLITWALEAAGTLGFATPLIAVQATTAISKAISKISDLIRKLVKTIGNVSPLIRRVIDKLDEIIQALAKLGRKVGGGGSTTPSSAPNTPGIDAPTVKSPDAGTTPSSATTTPSGAKPDAPSTTPKPDSTSPSNSSPDGTGTTGDGRAVAPGQSGGSSRPRVDDSVRSYMRNEEWSNDAYESIRASDDIADVSRNLQDAPRLDGSTGFSTDEVERIKNHVFHETHPLEGMDGGVVHERFEPNPDMAEAWMRLRSGRHQPEDLALLEHELAESNYWQQNPNAVYWEAHRAANEVSNWESQIPAPTNEDYNEPWR